MAPAVLPQQRSSSRCFRSPTTTAAVVRQQFRLFPPVTRMSLIWMFHLVPVTKVWGHRPTLRWSRPCHCSSSQQQPRHPLAPAGPPHHRPGRRQRLFYQLSPPSCPLAQHHHQHLPWRLDTPSLQEEPAVPLPRRFHPLSQRKPSCEKGRSGGRSLRRPCRRERRFPPDPCRRLSLRTVSPLLRHAHRWRLHCSLLPPAPHPPLIPVRPYRCGPCPLGFPFLP
mmetsp:Transcript_17526/g.34050  ORF Transcript_17526/g.34050 Transcript_17526/m.34050 type:complete len:223 (-) Transcript_17526:664-1332(-)